MMMMMTGLFGHINIQVHGSSFHETRCFEDICVSRILHVVQNAELLNV